MEENKEKKSGSFLNIPEFWMKQRKAWRITVYRTSMERLAYKMIFALLVTFHHSFGCYKNTVRLYHISRPYRRRHHGPFCRSVNRPLRS